MQKLSILLQKGEVNRSLTIRFLLNRNVSIRTVFIRKMGRGKKKSRRLNV
jgi:hypothetical protein